jgi:hypothetical protein
MIGFTIALIVAAIAILTRNDTPAVWTFLATSIGVIYGIRIK